MTPGTADSNACKAVVLDSGDALLDELRADPTIDFIDHLTEQRDELRKLCPPPPDNVSAEPSKWAYYPWRRTVVRILGPRGFERVRLDRNRNLITTTELARLRELHVGVVGLSVGHAVAYTLAAQGLCGALRLADFDTLDLSNLNRVPATVFDLGVNKAVVCARRIAELDPYLPVTVLTTGVTAETVDDFLNGLDVVVEECDSLDAKVLVREAARARRIPVLMGTSDRGLLDVERFDLEPDRPLLHGLVGNLDAAQLATLDGADKVPYSLRLVDATRVSSRMAASLIEVGETLSTWPQLSSEVTLNASATAEAVRRIALGENLSSGRTRIDLAEALDRVEDPSPAPPDSVDIDTQAARSPSDDPREAIASAAARAPSGGNAQPWRIEVTDSSVSIALVPEYATTMDLSCRASAVAVGAAAFNARVAAAAHHMVGEVAFASGDESAPLIATVRLTGGEDPELGSLYEPMLQRETNRRRSDGSAIPDDVIELLEAAADSEGARLRILRGPDELGTIASVLAAADRVRYLTPQLHADMFSELRWPDDESLDSGIDVRTLDIPSADLVMLDVLRRAEVMAHLRAWDGGAALGEDTYGRVLDSAAVGVVYGSGPGLTDYARAGMAVESVWVRAQQQGLAVQPVSPVFLYAVDTQDLHRLSPAFAEHLGDLQYTFRKLTGVGPAETEALVLRFGYAPRPSVPSRRRGRSHHLY